MISARIPPWTTALPDLSEYFYTLLSVHKHQHLSFVPLDLVDLSLCCSTLSHATSKSQQLVEHRVMARLPSTKAMDSESFAPTSGFLNQASEGSSAGRDESCTISSKFLVQELACMT